MQFEHNTLMAELAAIPMFSQSPEFTWSRQMDWNKTMIMMQLIN